MSATATFTSQAVAEWVKIFPRQMTETYTSSVTFMKQLTVVAISTITYLKNVFPEDSYTIENFGGIRLRILKKKCRHELAQFVSTALSQAFEAFDKKYLHQLVICFYDGECKVENLVEYHIFEYSYTSEGVSLDVQSSRGGVSRSSRYSFDSVRDRTLQLLRACVVVMQACQGDLPDTYDVSLRLYYNDSAPEGYQAPGFLTSEEERDQLEATRPDSVRLGAVETPFHKLTARTYVKENVGSSHEANPSQNPPLMSQIEHDDFDGSSVAPSASEASDTRLQCPCNKHDYDEQVHAILTCYYCNTQQHAACFGVRREHAGRVSRHCCTACSDRDPNLPPTDTRLAALEPHKRQCLCIFRRSLEWCALRRRLSAARLAAQFGVSGAAACKLAKLLQAHGVIAHGPGADLSSPREVLSTPLQEVMSKFFQHEEPAELPRSQHSLDPVGDVLTPMEKVSLQNETTVGKIIEPAPEPVIQDEGLQEYRAALLSHVEEEGLPLSGTHNPVPMEEVSKNMKRKMTTRRTGVRTKRTRNNKD
ncbi:uncharacterized protein LOC142974217 [Anticarsia gemmatalis]|uniref:uncharacterized protein LOC142974217 n=1 Tax=Anticarsia gemmatalis TaxID=129554 RepID=UPI003F7694A0